MKKLLFILLILFSGFLLKAQKIELVDASADVIGQVAAIVETPIKFINNSDHPINVKVSIIDEELGATQSITLCLGEDCYENSKELPEVITLIPEEILENFRIILNAGQIEQFSSAIIRIQNVDNPADHIDHEINFRIDSKIKDALYATGDMLIGTVYPNPVHEVAMINYKLKDDTQDVKIVLHNVLGSTIEEFELQAFETQLKFYTSDYNPGVYFYTLYIDNDGIATKKMIVRN